MSIADQIIARAGDDDSLAEDAKYVILAALEGDAALRTFLDNQKAPEATEAGAPPPPPPVKAYLRNISVQGFRGIGERASLPLTPGNGLTVVAGRNGSGKSSFSEALEVAMGGVSENAASRRWNKQWRNLHHRTGAAISVETVAEDVGRLDVALEWDDDENSLKAFSSHTQGYDGRSKLPRVPGTSHLGWRDHMELHPAILSYDDLGSMLDGRPSQLYDAVERVLGLGELTEAQKLLAVWEKEAGQAHKQALAAKKTAAGVLKGIDDERAREAERLLRKHGRQSRVEEVARLLAGHAGTEDPVVAHLRQLSELTVPPGAQLALAEWREAAERSASADATLGRQVRTTSSLLEHALELHVEHAEAWPCPVCGVGELDGMWEESTRARLAQVQEQLAAADADAARLKAAEKELGRVRPGMPGPLRRGPAELPELGAARNRWQAWLDADARGSDTDQLMTSLEEATEALRVAAGAELERRVDDWYRASEPLTDWLKAAREALVDEPRRELLMAAGKWLKENIQSLREERLRPLTEHARAIWKQLRQGSNVALETIMLEGTGTKRHLRLAGTVDDEETTALPVLSQGELHAMTLSLFVPRALLPGSPFGFLVLDDPIQAMDPGKIKGFVDVLHELSQHRQVVVFSHDDRLPTVLRRSSIPCTLLEIKRDAASQVEVTRSQAPVDQYLADAWAIARDPAVSDAEARTLLPSVFRLAVEYQARELYWGLRLAEGCAETDVEWEWEAAHKTSSRVQMALGWGSGPCREFDTWLTRYPYRKQTLGIATSGAHSELRGPTSPRDAVRDLDGFLRDLRGEKRGR